MALPYPSMTFVPFDILTAAELNNMHSNTVALAAGTGLDAGAVTGDKMSLSTLHYYDEITSSFATTSTTDVAVTGLSITLTVPTGGASYNLTFSSPSVYNSSTNYNNVKIWDGTIGVGTPLLSGGTYGSNGTSVPLTSTKRVTLSAGSHTLNVSLSTNGGTANILASAVGQATSIFLDRVL